MSGLCWPVHPPLLNHSTDANKFLSCLGVLCSFSIHFTWYYFISTFICVFLLTDKLRIIKVSFFVGEANTALVKSLIFPYHRTHRHTHTHTHTHTHSYTHTHNHTHTHSHTHTHAHTHAHTHSHSLIHNHTRAHTHSHTHTHTYTHSHTHTHTALLIIYLKYRMYL